MKETKSLTVDTLHCTSLLTSLPQLSQLQLEHLVAASLPAAVSYDQVSTRAPASALKL